MCNCSQRRCNSATCKCSCHDAGVLTYDTLMWAKERIRHGDDWPTDRDWREFQDSEKPSYLDPEEKK